MSNVTPIPTYPIPFWIIDHITIYNFCSNPMNKKEPIASKNSNFVTKKEKRLKLYQLSEKGRERTRWRLKPWGLAKVGMRGACMKRCMNSICLGLESLVPRDKPNGRGSPGTGEAEPSRVLGVEMSKSQNPPPSITHLSFLIFSSLLSQYCSNPCCYCTLWWCRQKTRMLLQFHSLTHHHCSNGQTLVR